MPEAARRGARLNVKLGAKLGGSSFVALVAGFAVEVEEGGADAEVIKGKFGGGVAIAKVPVSVDDGVERLLNVTEVAGIAGYVVDCFNATVEHSLGVAAGERDILGNECVGHPGGVRLGGVGGWQEGDESRQGRESEEHC